MTTRIEQYVILTLEGVGEWSSREADAVFEAFHGECEFGSRNGLTFIEVPIPTADVWHQLPRLTDAAHQALPGARVARVEVMEADQAETVHGAA